MHLYINMSKNKVQDALKWCHTCGRSFNWRPSMSLDWENVKYCSKTCRSKKPQSNRIDQGIEKSFLTLLNEHYLDPIIEKRKITCEQVQDYDGGERSVNSSTNGIWRERYRRAARRLSNVQLICDIEHSERGNNNWINGDGKGIMRVWIKEGKVEEARNRLDHITTALQMERM